MSCLSTWAMRTEGTSYSRQKARLWNLLCSRKCLTAGGLRRSGLEVPRTVIEGHGYMYFTPSEVLLMQLLAKLGTVVTKVVTVLVVLCHSARQISQSRISLHSVISKFTWGSKQTAIPSKFKHALASIIHVHITSSETQQLSTVRVPFTVHARRMSRSRLKRA